MPEILLLNPKKGICDCCDLCGNRSCPYFDDSEEATRLYLEAVAERCSNPYFELRARRGGYPRFIRFLCKHLYKKRRK